MSCKRQKRGRTNGLNRQTLPTFHRFMSLPPELRNMVYDFTDSTTLRSLTETSATIRAETLLIFYRKTWFVLDLRLNSSHCFVPEEAFTFTQKRHRSDSYVGRRISFNTTPPLDFSGAKYVTKLWLVGHCRMEVGPPPISTGGYGRGRPHHKSSLSFLASFENLEEIVYDQSPDIRFFGSSTHYKRINGAWVSPGGHGWLAGDIPKQKELKETREGFPFITGPYRTLYDFIGAHEAAQSREMKLNALKEKVDPEVRKKLPRSKRTDLKRLRKQCITVTCKLDYWRQRSEEEQEKLRAAVGGSEDQFLQVLEEQLENMPGLDHETHRPELVAQAMKRARETLDLTRRSGTAQIEPDENENK